MLILLLTGEIFVEYHHTILFTHIFNLFLKLNRTHAELTKAKYRNHQWLTRVFLKITFPERAVSLFGTIRILTFLVFFYELDISGSLDYHSVPVLVATHVCFLRSFLYNINVQCLSKTIEPSIIDWQLRIQPNVVF